MVCAVSVFIPDILAQFVSAKIAVELPLISGFGSREHDCLRLFFLIFRFGLSEILFIFFGKLADFQH